MTEKDFNEARECLRNTCREHFANFAGEMEPLMEWTDFHTTYYEILDMFAKGLIPKLMVTIPPQHGKSQGSTRTLPPFILGQDPDKKILLGSYAASLAQDFCRDVQRIIDSPQYADIFPGTYLSGSNVVTRSNMFKRNMNIIECVGHRGFFKVGGRGGAFSGTPADIVILDDVYKDAAEGNSPVIRKAAWDWYKSVILKRLHNKSQQLIVFTRWHQDDLIGRISKREQVIEATKWSDLENIPKGAWIKLNLPALKVGPPVPLDKRQPGEALWPNRHSEEKLQADRAIDPVGFECMNQGNPTSPEGMLYGPFKTYASVADYGAIVGRGNYTDTADTGSDYLCSVSYLKVRSTDLKDDKGQPMIFALVTDVVYSQQPTEKTVPMVAAMLNSTNTEDAEIESNNGGRSFATQVAQKCTKTVVRWFHQGKNKESRITTNSNLVNIHVIMPVGWEDKWPAFHEHLTGYRREFEANEFHDAADTCTGIVERGITYKPPRGIKRRN